MVRLDVDVDLILITWSANNQTTFLCPAPSPSAPRQGVCRTTLRVRALPRASLGRAQVVFSCLFRSWWWRRWRRWRRLWWGLEGRHQDKFPGRSPMEEAVRTAAALDAHTSPTGRRRRRWPRDSGRVAGSGLCGGVNEVTRPDSGGEAARPASQLQ